MSTIRNAARLSHTVGVIRESSWRIRKRMWQKIWPGAPSLKLLVGAGAIVLAGPFILTYVAGSPWWNSADQECKAQTLGCGLGTHLIGTALFGLLAYYLFFLRREARAAAAWRAHAKRTPERLFPWLGSLSGGLTGMAAASAEPGAALTAWRRHLPIGRPTEAPLVDILGRKDLVAEIADDLDDDCDPQVIVAPTAAGKTMVLIKLADCLARRGQVPVAISLRGQPNLDFERLARRAFETASGAIDEEEARKQWRWLRRRNLITIIADDLEKANARPEAVVRALEQAARQKLRLVAASRPNGVPSDFQRGTIELEPLNDAEVIEDLLGRMRRAGTGTDEATRTMVKAVVTRAGISSTPYYLSLARVLAADGELATVANGGDVRLSLLRAYRHALAAGVVREDAGLTPDRRQDVLGDLEAIAFVCLQGLSSQKAIVTRLETIGASDIDVASTLRDARRLGVVQTRHDGQVHFTHGTTLAYFASCFLTERQDKRELWQSLTERKWSPLRSLALVFASSGAGDNETPRYICRRLLDRVASTNGGTAGGSCGRANWIATAAEIARRADSLDVATAEAIVGGARVELGAARRIGYDHVGIMDSLAGLRVARAYEVLWDYATTSDDYGIRRHAIKALTRGGAWAVDASIPVIDAVMQRARDHATALTAPASDDRGAPFDELKAVAWILPSLRGVAGLGALQRKLNDYQTELLEHANRLTVQRGLEASIAQGLKLAAIQRPSLPTDRFVLEMLRDGPLHAQFWFSRVLLLQALTRRSIASPTDEARTLFVASESDEHAFVHEIAKLCRRALDRGRAGALLFADISEAASSAPHGSDVGISQLIGDIVLALNLNEYGSPDARNAFGTDNRLPACLAASPDRSSVLELGAHDDSCPFARFQSEGCLCPYTYDPPKSGNRRELSRAFCRHQRLHAKRLPWHPGVGVKELQKFWRGMEDLARF
jgi:hypothetical protein